jgi:hypothetical protein
LGEGAEDVFVAIEEKLAIGNQKIHDDFFAGVIEKFNSSKYARTANSSYKLDIDARNLEKVFRTADQALKDSDFNDLVKLKADKLENIMLQRESDNLTSTILTEGRILSSKYTADKVGNAELKFLLCYLASLVHLGQSHKKP